MELKYLAEMEKHGLSKSDLPEDAQVGIDEINKVIRAINMLESKGNAVKPSTLKKLKTMDKWVYYEILDHLHDTDKNEEEMEVDADEVVEEIEEQIDENEDDNPDTGQADEMGVKIDKELRKMHDSGKSDWNIDEIKSTAKNTYNAIWEAYESGEENGVETSNYSLLETQEEIFTLKQK